MCYNLKHEQIACPPVAPHGDTRRVIDYEMERIGEEQHCYNCETITVGYVVIDQENLRWLVTMEHFDVANVDGPCIVNSEGEWEVGIEGCIEISPLSCCEEQEGYESQVLTFEEFLELGFVPP